MIYFLQNKNEVATYSPMAVNNKPSEIVNVKNVTIDNIDPKILSTSTPITIPNPVKANVWQEIINEFKLDHNAKSHAVQAEIHKLLSNQVELYRVLKAAGPYLFYINNQIKEKGLPSELALIPFIESEYNPYDHSNKGASGLWQLMVGTAKQLGVKVAPGYDGRRNLIASTQAALTYFTDLSSLFHGNWYLAIAAYNCGQGKVFSALRRAGTHDFWKLSLPKETKLYVPKLLAIASIIKNHEKYGITLPDIHNKPFFTQVSIKKHVNLDHYSKKTSIDIKLLKKLNADYTPQALSRFKNYSLLVPANSNYS